MSKPISSYPESERRNVVARRLPGSARGLGYISAVKYAVAHGLSNLIAETKVPVNRIYAAMRELATP